MPKISSAPTFAVNNGTVRISLGDGNDHGASLALQPDGKVVMGGGSSGKGSDYDFALSRYNADGSLDTSFGTSGKVITSIHGDSRDLGQSIVLHPCGRDVRQDSEGCSLAPT